MAPTLYNLVFRGELLPGFTPEQVKLSFGQQFSLAPGQVEQLFASASTVLKKQVSAELGEQYGKRLAAIGMQVEMQAIAAAPHELSLVMEDHAHTDTQAPISSAAPATKAASQSKHVWTDVPAPARTSPRNSDFQFTGQGGEYFGIWIVNLLLSILTLGIYSAWAKVRNKKYFYGHTHLEGSQFEYTGDPLKILFGRLIAAVLFALTFFMEMLTPLLAIIVFVLLFTFFPWAIRQSLRFNARNSLYRGLRFSFQGRLSQSYWVFFLLPVLSIFTLGLLLPFVIQRQQAYMLSNHHFGTSGFHFQGKVGDYYIMALMIMAVMLFGGLAIVVLAMLSGVMMYLSTALGTLMMVISMMAGYLLLYMLIIATYSVYIANLKYNNTTLLGHGFEADWQIKSFTKLILTNTLLTVVTLGLFIPFAKVRSARYAAEHTQALIAGDLDHFIADEIAEVSAIGEGMGDLFDFDLGL